MAQGQDIRVRLSPEGVSEVVSAFRKVEREAGTTARTAATQIGALNGVVRELASLLPAISLAAFSREVITRTIDAERAFNRLNTVLKTTGFSAGITAKELNQIAEELKQSTPFDDDEIRKGIAALLRFRDVQGDVFRRAIRLTADLAVAMDTDFASAAQRLGRAVTDPESGMRSLRAAGIQLSESQIELAKNFKNTGDTAGAAKVVLDALQKSVGGAAAGENVGLYGATKNLGKAWDDLLKAIGKMQTIRGETFINALTRDIKTLAKTIEESKILQSLLAFATFGLMGTGGDAQSAVDSELQSVQRQLQQARQQLAAGTTNPPGSSKSFFSFLVPDIKLGEEAVKSLKETIDRLEREEQRLLRIRSSGQTVPTSTAASQADEDEARAGQAARDRERQEEADFINRKNQLEKRIALARSSAEHELQQEKATAALRLRVLDQYYSQGLISLEEFHKARRAVIEIELQKELQALTSKMEAEAQALARAQKEGDVPKQIAALVALDKLINESERLKARAAGERVVSVLQEQEQRKKLGQEQLQLDVQLLESQGKRKEAALKALEEEIRKTRELLVLQGKTPEQITSRVGELRDTRTRNIEFEDQGTRAAQALRQIDLEREAINRDVAQGLIFQFQGEERIIALEQRRLPVLREIAAEMQRTAFTDEQKLQADEFAAAVERIAVNINKAGREMAEFKQRAFEAVSSDLSTFLTDGIRDAKSFGEAIRTLGFNISRSLQKISADILAKQILEKGLSLLGVAGDGPEKVALAAAAGTAQATPLTAASAALSAAGTTVIAGATAISAAAAQLLAAASALTAAGAASAAGGAAGGAGAFAGFFASAAAGAEGGLITGPGTGTSDSIPARLSTGEFVVRAAAVRRIGLADLQAINRGMRPYSINPINRGVRGFAEGGLVEGGRAGFDGTLTVRAAPGTEVVDFTSSSRKLVTTIQHNKRAIRAALGL